MLFASTAVVTPVAGLVAVRVRFWLAACVCRPWDLRFIVPFARPIILCFGRAGPPCPSIGCSRGRSVSIWPAPSVDPGLPRDRPRMIGHISSCANNSSRRAPSSATRPRALRQGKDPPRWRWRHGRRRCRRRVRLCRVRRHRGGRAPGRSSRGHRLEGRRLLARGRRCCKGSATTLGLAGRDGQSEGDREASIWSRSRNRVSGGEARFLGIAATRWHSWSTPRSSHPGPQADESIRPETSASLNEPSNIVPNNARDLSLSPSSPTLTRSVSSLSIRGVTALTRLSRSERGNSSSNPMSLLV